MKQDIKCGLCGAIFTAHGYQLEIILYHHWQQRHPIELGLVVDGREKYDNLKKKHKCNVRDRYIDIALSTKRYREKEILEG